MQLKEITVNLSFPGGPGISGTWRPNESEREASWEMYVELVTRVTVVELGPDEGFLHEALSSYYSLFETTRHILKKYGSAVGRPKGRTSNEVSFGVIAVAVLNRALRPLLARWHPLLEHYESQRSPSTSPLEHEQAWPLQKQLRDEISSTRDILVLYSNYLAKIANVPSLS
jgi:hypothetical protein